jgi:nicotinamide-nucleotide amidase
MDDLVKLAERVAALLKQRKETIAVSESSTGGLITASLLAVPGASAYCLGGVVLYTRQAWHAVRDFDEALLKGARSATEENAMLRAVVARERFQATWGLGETGAAGPTGNRYGDPAGHTCIAVAGAVRTSRTLRTDRSERLDNMHAFTAAALELLGEVLSGNFPTESSSRR